MMRNRVAYLLSGLCLVITAVLIFGISYARYQESISGDQGFLARPLEQLTFSTQKWEQNGEGEYVLKFSLQETAESCRMYLATSEGIKMPENLDVTLTLPATLTTETLDDGTEITLFHEPVVMVAVAQQITESSPIYSLFGPGYVFCFSNDETGEENILTLETGKTYVLTIGGVQQAAEQASLLRLFVEHVK